MKVEEFIEQQLGVNFEEEPGVVTVNVLALKSMLLEFTRFHIQKAIKEKMTKMQELREEDGSYALCELDAFTNQRYEIC